MPLVQLGEMSWSWPSVSDVTKLVTAPVKFAEGAVRTIAGETFNTVGSVVGGAVGTVGSVSGKVLGASGALTNQAVDLTKGLVQKTNLGGGGGGLPALGPESDSNLPLYLGLGAAGLLVAVLLLRRPAAAS